jgi:hypothetical protein
MPEGSIGQLIEIAIKKDGKRLGEDTLSYYKRLIQEAEAYAEQIEDAASFVLGGSL